MVEFLKGAAKIAVGVAGGLALVSGAKAIVSKFTGK
jgi:hypothetical protein